MNLSFQKFEEWVELYSQDLFNQAFYLLSHKEDAEDLVQEVFISAYNSIDKFEQRSSPLAWLSGILRHKVADFYRKKYKNATQVNLDLFFNKEKFWIQTKNLDAWDEDQSPLDDASFYEYLEKCIDELPQKWSLLVKLTYLEQKKFTDMCQEIDITPTNYWKILQRSRLQLRECLEINWFTY